MKRLLVLLALIGFATPAFSRVCLREFGDFDCFSLIVSMRLAEENDLTFLRRSTYHQVGSTGGWFSRELDGRPEVEISWVIDALTDEPSWADAIGAQESLTLKAFAESFHKNARRAACGMTCGYVCAPKPEGSFVTAGGVISVSMYLTLSTSTGESFQTRKIAAASIDNCEGDL